MPFIPFNPGVVEAVVNMTLTGIPCVLTLGYRFLTGAAVVADGQALADALSSPFIADLLAPLSHNLIVDNIIVNELSSSTSWTATNTDPHVGGVAAEAVANQAAMVVTFSTAFRGRSFRGRNYVPGLTEASKDSARFWTAGAVTDIQSIYEDMNSAVFALGWQHSVLSRVNAGSPRVLGVATDVIAYEAKLLIATIRGRLT